MRVNLAREWLDQGIKVEFVLCQARGQLLEHVPDRATIVDLETPRFRGVFRPLARYLRKSAPDALLAAMWPLTVIAPLAAKWANFKGSVVISEHSILSRAYVHRGALHRFFMRTSMWTAYRWASYRVAVSAGVADDLANLSGLKREAFSVVHNPAATGQSYDAVSPPPELGKRLKPVILAVGTLKPVKRFDLLISAFARVKRNLDASLCILGEGSEREALEQQVVDLGLQQHVILPGFVAETGPWYANADLFVLCSDYEGFANVIVEALEHGVPVVSTDCPSGPSEILENGRYGRLVPVGDAKALADAICEALAESPDRNALKARAQDFSSGRIANQYLSLLSI